MPYQAFARTAVNPQVAQRLETTTLPAPSRGIIMDENQSFMQPGGAIICDNWKPTLRGAALRGGSTRWCVLPETTPVISGFQYASGNNQRMFAANSAKLYDVTTSSPTLVQGGQLSGNYAAAQMANQGGDFLIAVNDAGDYPLRYNGTTWSQLNGTPPPNWGNGFVYAVGARAFDTADRSYWKCAVAHTAAASGTFAADRTAHPTYWVPDTAADGIGWIVGPAGTTVQNGGNLTYVCKYKNRLFFIEGNSMNVWYLGLNAVAGTLALVPLSGAATRGGKLLWIGVWSVGAGDGLDDKIVFGTDLGELIIFSGSNPSDASNWRQEGRYQVPPPMGMNAHIQMGGDILIATRSGIVPISASISKTPEELELAMITRSIKPMWRDEVIAKSQWSWTMMNWEEYGGIFVTWPGGNPGNQYCAVVNAATSAWARFTGWDATCFIRLRNDMFFGTQTGVIMQADRTGYDDGQTYLCTLVGGWEMFQSPSQTITWRQARAVFAAPPGQPFLPALSACTDFVITLPPAPVAGPDPGLPDAWDEGHWGPDMGGPPPPVPTPPQRAAYAQWDQVVNAPKVIGNTMWVSIGLTGFTHAPIVMVTVGQQVKPEVELISITATFERGGINV